MKKNNKGVLVTIGTLKVKNGQAVFEVRKVRRKKAPLRKPITIESLLELAFARFLIRHSRTGLGRRFV